MCIRDRSEGLLKQYVINYVNYVSCTVFEILTFICQKLRRHVILITPTWRQFVIITRLTVLASIRVQNSTILSSAIPEKFKGCKILKWITWPGPRLFQGWSVIRRLILGIALAVPEIFQGVWNSKIGHLTLTTPTSRTVGHLEVSTSCGQTVHKIWSL